MKIAICLRGQPRFIAEGAMLYNLLLKNRYKDKYEFKIFGHSWENVSDRMVSTDGKNRQLERERSTELDQNQIVRDIIKWDPTTFTIQNEKECAKIVRNIIGQLIRTEKTTNSWIQKYANVKDFDSLFLLIPIGLEFDRQTNVTDMYYNINCNSKDIEIKMKMEYIRYTYLLGQLYSAGVAFDQLAKYKEKNPDYEPDIVISTRWDAFIWFHDMESMLRELNHASIDAPTLYTQRITISNGLPIMNDFVFISNFNGMNKLLGNIKDRLFKSFTQPSYKMFNLVGSGSRLQHLLWTKISDLDLNITQPTGQFWDASVLRPGCFNLDNIQPSYKYFVELKQASMKYIYPKDSIPSTLDEINIQWQRLIGSTNEKT